MFEKNDNWHKIAESLAEMNFSTEGIATVELENKKLCIILFREALYACNSTCKTAATAAGKGIS